MTDEELMAAVAAGDREAFGALYRRRRPDVYRFALHMTGIAAAAEDVAQEVFLAVIQDARRYSPARAAVLPWLLGIARNHARRRSSERQHDPLPEGGSEPAVQPDPLEGLARTRQSAARPAGGTDRPR